MTQLDKNEEFVTKDGQVCKVKEVRGNGHTYLAHEGVFKEDEIVGVKEKARVLVEHSDQAQYVASKAASHNFGTGFVPNEIRDEHYPFVILLGKRHEEEETGRYVKFMDSLGDSDGHYNMTFHDTRQLEAWLAEEPLAAFPYPEPENLAWCELARNLALPDNHDSSLVFGPDGAKRLGADNTSLGMIIEELTSFIQYQHEELEHQTERASNLLKESNDDIDDLESSILEVYKRISAIDGLKGHYAQILKEAIKICENALPIKEEATYDE